MISTIGELALPRMALIRSFPRRKGRRWRSDSMRCLRLCFWALIAIIGMVSGSSAVRGAHLLVAGQNSNNVVRFDIATGADSLYATYSMLSAPRGLALDEKGQLYSSTNQGNQNVVKFVAQAGPTS
jgi:hypothetical protein